MEIKTASQNLSVLVAQIKAINAGDVTAQIMTAGGAKPSIRNAMNAGLEAAASAEGTTLTRIYERLAWVESGGVSANIAPVASNISKSVDQDGSVVIAIVATDYDGSIDYTATAITAGPNHGTVSVDPVTGAATYIPTTNYYGLDEFRITVADNNGLVSNEAVISITVNELGAPVYDAVGIVGETLIGGIEIDAVGVVGETIYGGMVVSPNIVDHVWTPTKGPDGVVLDSSWQELSVSPLNAPIFYEIAGLDPITQIDAALTTAGFDLVNATLGNTGASSKGTFNAWIGQAFDPLTNTAYIPWGGGHADSSINGVWKFDVNRLAWTIASMPSDPDAPGAEWSAAYRDTGKGRINDPAGGVPTDHNSFSKYIDGTTEVIGGKTVWVKSYVLPDGKPPSTHQYGGVYFKDGWVTSTRDRKHSFNTLTGEYKTEVWTRPYNQDLRPDTCNHAYVYNDKIFGTLRGANEVRFNKVIPASSTEIQAFNGPGRLYAGNHMATCVVDDKYMFSCIWLAEEGTGNGPAGTNEYALFNMDDETWGSRKVITGDTPYYTVSQEMQACIYLKNWGSEGSVLRQFTADDLQYRWFVLDLATSVQTEVVPTGNNPQGWLVGNKAFALSVGGIEAVIYTEIAYGRSTGKTYAMRLA